MKSVFHGRNVTPHYRRIIWSKLDGLLKRVYQRFRAFSWSWYNHSRSNSSGHCWADHWRPSTIRRQEGTLICHIIPLLGEINWPRRSELCTMLRGSFVEWCSFDRTHACNLNQCIFDIIIIFRAHQVVTFLVGRNNRVRLWDFCGWRTWQYTRLRLWSCISQESCLESQRAPSC